MSLRSFARARRRAGGHRLAAGANQIVLRAGGGVLGPVVGCFQRAAELPQPAPGRRRGGQGAVDRDRQRGGEIGAPSRQRLDRTADPPGGLGRVGATDGIDPAQRLVQDEGQRVEIGRLARGFALGLLRGHVGERPEDVAGAREDVLARQARAAEVGQLRRLQGLLAAVRDEHVLGLDVTVDHAAVVGVGEGPAERDADLEHLPVGQVPVRDQASRACGPRRARRSGTSRRRGRRPRTGRRSRGGTGGRRRAPRASRARRRRRLRGGSASAPPRAGAARPRPATRRRSRPRRGARAAGSAPARAPARAGVPEPGRPTMRRVGASSVGSGGARRSISVRCESTGLRVRRGGRHSLRGRARKCVGMSAKLQENGLTGAPVILRLLVKYLQRQVHFCRSLTTTGMRRLSSRPRGRPEPRRPRPRSPRAGGAGPGGPGALDEHTLIVRRRVALGVRGGAADRDRADRQRLRQKRKNPGPEELQPVRQPDRAGIGRTGGDAAVHDARQRLEQAGAGSRGAGGPAAHPGTGVRLTGSGPQRAERDGGGPAQPAADLQLARGSDREADGAAAQGPRRQRQAVDRIHRGGDGDPACLRRAVLPAGGAPDPADAGRTRRARHPDEPVALPAEPRLAGTEHRELTADRHRAPRAPSRPRAGPTAAR